jgi:hypothetical protein
MSLVIVWAFACGGGIGCRRGVEGLGWAAQQVNSVTIVSKLDIREKEKEMYVGPNDTCHCSGL